MVCSDHCTIIRYSSKIILFYFHGLLLVNREDGKTSAHANLNECADFSIELGQRARANH